MIYTAALLLLPAILASSSPTTQPMSMRRDGLLSLDARVSACVALGAELDLSAQALGLAGADVHAKVGACVCVDAKAKVDVLASNALLGINADVDVYVQVGVQANANAYVDVHGQPGKDLAAQLGLGLGGLCNTPSSLLSNSEPDFSKGCCARKCKPGYFRGVNLFLQPICTACPADRPRTITKANGDIVCKPACRANEVELANGDCLCPLPRLVQGNKCDFPQCPAGQKGDGKGGCVCEKDNEFLCGSACYKKSEYTCPSGIATPNKQIKRSRYQCTGGKTYCPAVAHSGWECIDTMADIESCGGCADPSNPFGGNGAGADCTAIAGTNVVSCHLGECRIHSCQDGWAFTEDGKACAPVPAVQGEGRNKTQQKMVIMRRS